MSCNHPSHFPDYSDKDGVIGYKTHICPCCSGNVLVVFREGKKAEEPKKPQTIDEIYKQAIIDTYRLSGRNKAKTARILGISEKTLYNKIKMYRMKEELRKGEVCKN